MDEKGAVRRHDEADFGHAVAVCDERLAGLDNLEAVDQLGVWPYRERQVAGAAAQRLVELQEVLRERRHRPAILGNLTVQGDIRAELDELPEDCRIAPRLTTVFKFILEKEMRSMTWRSVSKRVMDNSPIVVMFLSKALSSPPSITSPPFGASAGASASSAGASAMASCWLLSELLPAPLSVEAGAGAGAGVGAWADSYKPRMPFISSESGSRAPCLTKRRNTGPMCCWCSFKAAAIKFTAART